MRQAIILIIAIAAICETAYAEVEYYDKQGQLWTSTGQHSDTCRRGWSHRACSVIQQGGVKIVTSNDTACYFLDDGSEACYIRPDWITQSRGHEATARIIEAVRTKAADEARAAAAKAVEAQQAQPAQAPAGGFGRFCQDAWSVLCLIFIIAILVSPFIFIYWCCWKTYCNVRDNMIVFFNTGMDAFLHLLPVVLPFAAMALAPAPWAFWVSAAGGIAYVLFTTIRNNKGFFAMDIVCCLVAKVILFGAMIPYLVLTVLCARGRQPGETPEAAAIREAADWAARAALLAGLWGLLAWLCNGNRVRAASSYNYERVREEYEYDQPRREEQPEQKTDWQILGIREGSSRREIEKAYREKIIMNHPDRLGKIDEEIIKFVTQRAQEINGAYERLCALAK